MKFKKYLIETESLKNMSPEELESLLQGYLSNLSPDKETTNIIKTIRRYINKSKIRIAGNQNIGSADFMSSTGSTGSSDVAE